MRAVVIRSVSVLGTVLWKEGVVGRIAGIGTVVVGSTRGDGEVVGYCSQMPGSGERVE
jgi:hypothetical protein